MASEAEIEAAMAAFSAKDDEVEGMESGKALRMCWAAALEAAERVRWQPIETAERNSSVFIP